MQNLKEVSQQHKEIESRIESLLSFLDAECQRLNKNADRLDNIDSLHM